MLGENTAKRLGGRLGQRAIDSLMRNYGRFDKLDDPMVSVIIPAHNEAGYIGKAIGSVRKQGYRNFEIIVVDDGSSDDTYQKAQEALEGAQYGRVLRFDQNKGPGAARNYGAGMAKGDVLVFMDADSQMEQGLLKEVKASMEKGYVGGKARYRSESGENQAFFGWTNLSNRILSPLTNLTGDLPQTGGGALLYMRTDTAQRIESQYGSLFPDARSGEDVELSKRLAGEGAMDYISDTGVRTSDRRIKADRGLLPAMMKKGARYIAPETMQKVEKLTGTLTRGLAKKEAENAK